MQSFMFMSNLRKCSKLSLVSFFSSGIMINEHDLIMLVFVVHGSSAFVIRKYRQFCFELLIGILLFNAKAKLMHDG